jgi:hypothetical protein
MYVFQPSDILDDLYNNVLEHYEVATNIYEIEVMKAIQKYMESKYPELEYTDEYCGDFVSGSYAVSWVENEKPVLLLLNYVGY